MHATYPAVSAEVSNNGHGPGAVSLGTDTPAVGQAAMPVTLVPATATYPGRSWSEAANRVLDGVGVGWRLLWKSVKLGICIGMDVLDFTVGRMLGFGIFFDLGCAMIATALWGKRGWWALLEGVDITEQIDGFIPTCTIIALTSWHDD